MLQKAKFLRVKSVKIMRHKHYKETSQLTRALLVVGLLLLLLSLFSRR